MKEVRPECCALPGSPSLTVYLHGDVHACACFCEGEQRIEGYEIKSRERGESFPQGGAGEGGLSSVIGPWLQQLSAGLTLCTASSAPTLLKRSCQIIICSDASLSHIPSVKHTEKTWQNPRLGLA